MIVLVKEMFIGIVCVVFCDVIMDNFKSRFLNVLVEIEQIIQSIDVLV